MDSNELIRTNDERIDELEAHLLENFEPVNCTVEHLFTKGQYTRTILMKKDSVITSLIHKHEHPFIISMGVAAVSINGEDVILSAPHIGKTKAGTRRTLVIIEDCVWTTVHKVWWITGQENELNEEEKNKILNRIYQDIIVPHENELIGGTVKNNIITKTIEDEN